MPLLKKGSAEVLINMHWYGILPLGFTKITNSVAVVSHHSEGCLQESIVCVLFNLLPDSSLLDYAILLHVLGGCSSDQS